MTDEMKAKVQEIVEAFKAAMFEKTYSGNDAPLTEVMNRYGPLGVSAALLSTYMEAGT